MAVERILQEFPIRVQLQVRLQEERRLPEHKSRRPIQDRVEVMIPNQLRSVKDILVQNLQVLTGRVPITVPKVKRRDDQVLRTALEELQRLGLHQVRTIGLTTDLLEHIKHHVLAIELIIEDQLQVGIEAIPDLRQALSRTPDHIVHLEAALQEAVA